MKVTRRQRGALILLLVAVVALAADRLLLPGPDTVRAAAGVAADVPEAATAAGLDNLLASPAFPEPAAEWSDQPIEDVFDFTRLADIDVSLRVPRDGQLEESAGEAFVREHTLQATILGPRPVAQLGRRMLSVGDSLDGWVLESVSDREAVFVSDYGRAVLRIAPRRRGP